MKRTLLICLFTLLVFVLKAQTKEAPPNIDIDAEAARDSAKLANEENDIPPSFPGGLDKFYKYVSKNIHYPPNAAKYHIEGKVFLTFVIERDGSITEVKLIHGLSSDIDAEAIRVISHSPKWNPAMQNGQPVRVLYRVPIDFKL